MSLSDMDYLGTDLWCICLDHVERYTDDVAQSG